MDSKKKRLIPFNWLPSHWGLSGESRDIAEIEYHYGPSYIRDEKIAMVKYVGLARDNAINVARRQHGLISDAEFERNRILLNFDGIEQDSLLLEHDFEHGNITKKDYDYGKVDLIEDIKEQQLAKLELDFNYHVISENEYQKEKATINDESWVSVIQLSPGNPDNDEMASMELDWNDKFIEEIREAGFKGKEDEDLINQWVTFLCRSVALQDLEGVGDFEEQLADRDMESWERKQMEMGITHYKGYEKE